VMVRWRIGGTLISDRKRKRKKERSVEDFSTRSSVDDQ